MRGKIMNQTTPLTGNLPEHDGHANFAGDRAASANRTSAKLDAAAQVAHQATDKIADRTTAQVDRLSGTIHRAVNTTADVASSGADWATDVVKQTQQAQQQLTEAACASIRARPFATLAGAAAIGYLLGRLARW
jgi:ElaB/YqjD/DUF883 family membrane-anchored ribosome-binding protein